MTRTEFPAAVAKTVTVATGLDVTADHVAPIALPLWDAAHVGARDATEFEAMLIAGTATLCRELRAL